MNKIPIIVCGALGRMGRTLIERALKTPDFLVDSGIVRSDSEINKPPHWPCEIKNELSYTKKAVIIDFSHSSKLPEIAGFALKHSLPLLVCTTGHSEQNFSLMREVATKIPLLYAANTSIMSLLLTEFTKMASCIPGITIHITDIHHSQKKDAPSGTALALKEAAGHDTNITSIRAADVVGEHRVHFFKENEQLELIHRVGDRAIFAEGALIAAQFLFDQGPGLYNMNDVVNLRLSIKK